MARGIVIAACCVLVIAGLSYSADASRICRNLCNLQCRHRPSAWRRGWRNWRARFVGVSWYDRQQSRMGCVKRCYKELRYCVSCNPTGEFCTDCKTGYHFNNNWRCVANAPAATTPATTTSPPVTAAVDPCSSNPCQNSGTCTGNADGSYTCTCDPLLWTGEICETATACNPSPCNTGTCSLSAGGYTCTCELAVWTGTTCNVQCTSPCTSPSVCVESLPGTGTCGTPIQ